MHILRTLGRDLKRELRATPLEVMSVAAAAGLAAACVALTLAVRHQAHGQSQSPATGEIVALHSSGHSTGDSTRVPEALSQYQLWSDELLILTNQPGPLQAVASYMCGLATVQSATSLSSIELCDVTEQFLDLPQKPIVLGRAPIPGANEVLASHSYWRTHLGATASLSGQSVDIDGTPHALVGVWSAGVTLPSRATGLWRLRTVTEGVDRWRAASIARLKPEIGIASAREQVEAVLLASGRWTGRTVAAESLPDLRIRAARPLIVALGFLACFVCAIATVTVTSAGWMRTRRTEHRRRIEVALGAPAGRVLASDVLPTIVTGCLGATLGIACADWMWRWVNRSGLLLTWTSANEEAGMSSPDSAAAFIAAGLLVVCGCLWPAWRAWHAAARARGGLQAREGIGARMRLTLLPRAILGANVLLVGMMLTITVAAFMAWQALAARDMGINVEAVHASRLILPSSTAADVAARAELLKQVAEDASEVAGARRAEAAVVNVLPLTDANVFRSVRRADRPFAEVPEMMAALRIVSTRYFQVVALPLLAGRGFAEADSVGSEQVVVVSEGLARRLFDTSNVVGRKVRCYPRVCTIIGVVRDVRHSIMEPPDLALYMSLSQVAGSSLTSSHVASAWIVTKASTSSSSGNAPSELVDSIRRRYPDVLATNAMPMRQLLEAQLRPRSLFALVSAALTAASVGLIAIAIFVVLRRSLVEQTAEIALRVALGGVPVAVVVRCASPWLSWVLLTGALGIVAGGAVAPYASRLLPQFFQAELMIREAMALSGGILVACATGATVSSCITVFGRHKLTNISRLLASA